jgi:crotonobetainyl-CoA:carnitine CoA-transferase CaiB-like acyl-CoA transferase
MGVIPTHFVGRGGANHHGSRFPRADFTTMPLLSGFHVAQLGQGLASSVFGRLFADSGATVSVVGEARATLLDQYMMRGKAVVDRTAALAAANLIVAEGGPAVLLAEGNDVVNLCAASPNAAIVLISPFGQTGPRADEPATDLTLMCASGIARMLTGQVDDLSEPPVRAVGRQSAYIGGIAAACAGMHAALSGDQGAVVDVSIQEALATLAMTDLARAGQTGGGWRRERLGDGNGATVCILPAADGFVAISPREEKQWASWLIAMGSPGWGADLRFARKQGRMAHWDEIHALMSEWSRWHPKQWIADLAQDAHVPSFPLREPAEQLGSPQLAHRGFLQDVRLGGVTVKVPSSPFQLSFSESIAPARPVATLPLAGVRVLDFSWVIAGPTATRHLAAMGAEVIKVEAPGKGDPGRASELHMVMGQAKKGVVLNLKKPEGVAIAKRLAAKCDVLIENFATGVMDRLGLGPEDLRSVNPNLIYLSASGLGRTGPESGAVAYGTLLQCYAGFAGLNRHPDRPPRVGMAWLDPMCGLILPFLAAASLWRQRERRGGGVRVDFSMIEAMLWAMPEALLAAQHGDPPRPRGNASDDVAPHGVYRGAGQDEWLSVAVVNDGQWKDLCALVPGLAGMEEFDLAGRRASLAAIDAALSAWVAPRNAGEAALVLTASGIPSAALASSMELVACEHLRARGFWDEHGDGLLPGLPWRSSVGREFGPAPELGEHTEAVLRDVLGLNNREIGALRVDCVLG